MSSWCTLQFFFSSRRRHTRLQGDWSSDVCSSDLCSIPATPFAEQQRAEYLAERFRQLGLSEVTIDEEGNCLGLYKGRASSPLIIVSAHLDTVFAEGTDFTVRREGERLLAPGIADDGCGLVALLALVQALRAAQIKLEGSILFVGT